MQPKPVPPSLRQRVVLYIGRRIQELTAPGAPFDAISLRQKRLLLARLLPALISLLALAEGVLFLFMPGYRPNWHAYLLLGGAYLLNQSRHYVPATILTIATFPITIVTIIATAPAYAISARVLLVVMSLLLTSIFASWRGFALLAVVNALILLLLPVLLHGSNISYGAIALPFLVNMLASALTLLYLSHQHKIERERQTLMRMSEERLQMALDAAAMGTWTWDVRSDSITWSLHVARLFGVAEDIRPTTFASNLEYIHPDDQALFERAIAAALADGSDTYQVIHRVLWPGGRLCWIEAVGRIYRDEAGAALYLAGTITDITRRWLAEAALRDSEERYRVISELVSDYAFAYKVAESGTAHLEWITDAFTRITGYTSQEMQALDQWTAYVHPFDLAIATQRRQTLLAGHADISEYRITAKDGHAIWTRLYSRPVRDVDAQRVVRVYGAVQDITELKRLEQQLNQAQKMEALGRLAGGVAHDFNNLLTVILGNVELLLAVTTDRDDVRYDAEQIQQAAKRAAELTRQLLAFSRQQVLEPRYLNLNEVVQTMSQLLQRLIGEDITLESRLAQNLGLVFADPSQLEQVLMNLAVNARDAMPSGGALTIETANVVLPSDHSRSPAGGARAPYVVLSISDTGTGMDAATRARIFEPFFTTKAVGKGTGLGLATVHGIIAQSGGHIDVLSELGQGTTLRIYLPQTNASEPSLSAASPQREIPHGDATILLVEDELLVRNMSSRILREYGYKVLEAENGSAALQIVRTYAEPIDLILTDLIMPGGLNGHQLAEQVLTLLPAIKVLYMSGYSDTVLTNTIFAPGQAFIAKPFTPATLAHKIAELIHSL
jgi:PAS domain S-box-containing protein